MALYCQILLVLVSTGRIWSSFRWLCGYVLLNRSVIYYTTADAERLVVVGRRVYPGYGRNHGELQVLCCRTQIRSDLMMVYIPISLDFASQRSVPISLGILVGLSMKVMSGILVLNSDLQFGQRRVVGGSVRCSGGSGQI